MKEKNNKGLFWIIAILVILVLGLISYIIYDKVFSLNNEPEGNNITTTTTSKKEEDSNVEWKLIENQLKTLSENEKIDLDYNLKCSKIENTDCIENELTINKKVYSISPTADILYNNKYIIIKDDGGSGFSGEMKLIDSDGELVFNTKYVGTLCPESGASECIYFGIKGNEEKIYFIEQQEDYLLKAIELNNNFNVVEVQKITNYHQAG